MILSKFRFNSFILLLIILIPYAVKSQIVDGINNSTEKLDIELLGINLGCSFNEIEVVLENSPNKINFLKMELIEGMDTYVYTGNHRLNTATGTSFSFWEGKLHSLSVIFLTDEAEDIYEALKMKLEAKYGKMKDELTFSGKSCTGLFEGMMVGLVLNTSSFETDQLLLIGMHTGISEAKTKKEIEDKANSLGDL